MCYNPERSSAGDRNSNDIERKGDTITMKKMLKNKWVLGAIAVIVIWGLWSVMKPAPAEAAEVGFTLGAEKKLEADTNAMYLDTSFGNVLGVDVTTGVNYTVTNGLDASFDNFELDLSKELNDKIKVYANNDFDVNLNHSETTVGFAIKF